MLTCPPLSGLDVHANLAHFALVSYAVPPERVRPHVDARFELDTFPGSDGTARVWVSLVPFQDQDFAFAALPWLKFGFGQTNYRTYVIDRQSGQRAVWFFGTTLASWTVMVPRFAWGLPWHSAQTRFEVDYNTIEKRYNRYRLQTESNWGPVELELADSGQPVEALACFDDLETGLVILTHPLVGVFYRQDGSLGTYRVWHERMQCSRGAVLHARIGLFERLGLVPLAEQAHPHSVLIQPQVAFSIYLPPVQYV